MSFRRSEIPGAESDSVRLSSASTASSWANSSTSIGFGDDSMVFGGDAECGCHVSSMETGARGRDTALLRQSRQESTVIAATDCQVLGVNEFGADEKLRPEVEQIQSEDLRFLRKSFPGIQALPKADRSEALRCFQKIHVPAGHTFVAQGERAKKAIYVISQGSVCLTCRDVSKFSGLLVPGARREDTLGKGRVFGSLGSSGPEPFYVRCETSCEMLSVIGEDLKKLPASVIEEVREYLAKDAASRHRVQDTALPCSPARTPGSIQRSLSTHCSHRSSSLMPPISPLVGCRTHCMSPSMAPPDVWQEEMNQILLKRSRRDSLKTSEGRRHPHSASTGSLPSLAKTGGDTFKLAAQHKLRCPAVGPFSERQDDRLGFR